MPHHRAFRVFDAQMRRVAVMVLASSAEEVPILTAMPLDFVRSRRASAFVATPAAPYPALQVVMVTPLTFASLWAAARSVPLGPLAKSSVLTSGSCRA